MSQKTASLSEKAGVVVFARIITTAIDLVTAVALVRLLSKPEVAVISFVLLVYQTARVLATLGFPDSIFYFFERVAKDARRALALQTISILGATALLAALIMLGLSAGADVLLSNWDPAERAAVENLLPLVALVALLEIPTWPFDNLMLASDRQRDAAWYQILTSALLFAGLVGPILLGFSLKTAVFGLLGYAVLRCAGSFWWILRVLPPATQRLPRGLLRKQIVFSVPLGLSLVVGRVNKQIDKFVVSLLLPATALANYTVGAQEIPVVTAIPFAVGSVLISRYVSLRLANEKEALRQLWYRGIEKVSLVVVPVTILFIATAQDFIVVVFGAEYAPAVLPFQIYSLIVLHRVTQYGGILQAFGDPRGVLQLTLILLATNLVLSIPFTLLLGIVGTALSTFLANMFSWYLGLRRIGKHMELPPGKVLPFPYYLRVLAISAACGLAIWLLRTFLVTGPSPALSLLWTATTYLMLVAAVGTLTGVITRRDWRQLADWLRLRMLFG